MRPGSAGAALAALLIATLWLSGIVGCAREDASPGATAASDAPSPSSWRTTPADWVGSARCATCHADESEAWSQSHHALAMQVPTPDTVLGRFVDAGSEAGAAQAPDDTRFSDGTTTAHFVRTGHDYAVVIEGPDGEAAPQRVAWLLGVDPLQQVLLEAPGGRLQALEIAWDTRPESLGGQRWFASGLEAPAPPGDAMHWSGLAWNANHMCIDCHTTGFEKGYDDDEARFESRFAESRVGCEACHGQGARHVAWAEAGAGEGGPALAVRFPEAAAFAFPPGEAIARSERSGGPGVEVETCAPCHARRLRIEEAPARARPLADDHQLALLREGLYHANGAVRDEVYVYGSFLQSRMARAGVQCSDCHDPHRATLRAEGNAVCAPCHQPTAFDTPTHHLHEKESPAGQCVTCHMPESVFMGIDARADHAFRVPDPDLAARIGAPDPCTGCHADAAPGFLSEGTARMRGERPPRAPHWGEALHAGRMGAPGAPTALRHLATDDDVPGIARATALELLSGQPDIASGETFVAALADADPLVRAAAVAAFQMAPPEVRVRYVVPLLRDPVRSVRFEAIRVLAPVEPEALGEDADLLARGWAELVAAEREHADRPDGQLRLARLFAARGDDAAAEDALREALRLEPGFVAAAVNLADHLRRTGRDAEGERILRTALARVGDEAVLHHALGLLLVRADRDAEAIASLERAADLAPRDGRMIVAAALARHEAGDPGAALARLESARTRLPGDRRIRDTLARLYLGAGDLEAAREVVRELAALAPADPQVGRLRLEIESRAEGGS